MLAIPEMERKLEAATRERDAVAIPNEEVSDAM